MTPYQIIFPNQDTLIVPPTAWEAIQQAKAKYNAPLWQFRAERTLKLGAHQWIYPAEVATARQILDQYPHGLMATAWKLFNRGWLGAAEAYWFDTHTYPRHPRQWGQGVVPLVDEDQASAQIGWVRINQYTAMDINFAVFVQFTLLDLFDPQPLPTEYL